MPLPRKQKEKKVPELPELLDKRDWTGAATLIEFERKVFMENKRASGWKAGRRAHGRGRRAADGRGADERRRAGCGRGHLTHLGQHKALDMQALLDGGATAR